MFEAKNDNLVIKLPYGFRDIFPIESGERKIIQGLIGKEFRQWGYGEVNTPVVEFTKNISAGVGEKWSNKLINFLDIDGSLVSLRTDMTIPIARLAGMRIKKSQLPARFCYFANSFRQSA
ncbi:MAG: ATP phosphoribosyltransferase regulatory subunit, partial [Candidatus Humimicrobiaceae bacterium]